MACQKIAADYETIMAKAKTCDSGDPKACSQRIVAGLLCRCETFINIGPDSAEMELGNAAFVYLDLGCFSAVPCAPCNVPTSGTCTPEGQCQDKY